MSYFKLVKKAENMCNYSESVRLAGIEEGKLRGAIAMIEYINENDDVIDKAINEMVNRFSMPRAKAEKLVEKYWK